MGRRARFTDIPVLFKSVRKKRIICTDARACRNNISRTVRTVARVSLTRRDISGEITGKNVASGHRNVGQTTMRSVKLYWWSPPDEPGDNVDKNLCHVKRFCLFNFLEKAIFFLSYTV